MTAISKEHLQARGLEQELSFQFLAISMTLVSLALSSAVVMIQDKLIPRFENDSWNLRLKKKSKRSI